MRFFQAEQDDPGIDPTPLVDVVFQLIIYFAVATTFAFLGAMKVNLPKAGTSLELTASQQKIMIVIDRTGEIYLEDQLLSFSELSERMKALAEQKANSLVVIQADKDPRHGMVVSVLDLARSLGFQRIAIATEPKPAEAKGEAGR